MVFPNALELCRSDDIINFYHVSVYMSCQGIFTLQKKVRHSVVSVALRVIYISERL